MDYMLEIYKIVFKDMVRNYLNDLQNKVELNESEICLIANNLVYKSDSMWEYIDETIGYQVGKVLNDKERSGNNG